ncbi:amidohydrolase family protein [Altererythrobacter sp. MTPC7]|uniref:metal-dependent hydrolase family protein n=1 Tax=Altererythrobacter sp. MTPC7 TaxID=3056567 RepID=UPI0036F2DAA1
MKLTRIMLAGVATLAMATPALADTTIIHAGAVLDSADGELSGPATITVTDGRIVSIADGFAPVPDGADRVHLPDHTVLPGLIDLHTHLSGDPSGEFWRAATTPPEWNVLVAAKNARVTARAGFTTVRDLGSRTDQVTQMLRRATEEGMMPGPRVVTSARTIAIVGGHGDTNGFRRGVGEILASDFTCTGAVECAETVRTASKYGADLIKITATGGVLSQQGRGLEAHFSDAEMKSIVDTAETLGLKVAAHAHGARGIEAAARAGVQTIEHGTYIDEQAGRVMREQGTILIPTLMALKGVSENLGTGFYTPVVEEKIRQVSSYMGTLVSRARDYGVKVAFGTDAGVFPHGRNAEEFALLREQGLTNREALASATTVAAEVIGLENEIGRLAPGYYADIIAVEGNPLTDVTVLENVDWTMVRGRVID